MIENHSGRTVIGATVWLQEADGDGPIHHSYYPQDGILDGKSDKLQKTVMLGSETPIIRAIVLNLVVADGEFVGADKGNDFEGFKSHLESERGIKLWKK